MTYIQKNVCMYLIVKIIILLRIIIKFLMSWQLTIFHQMCEYFCFFFKNFSWILYIWFRPKFFYFLFPVVISCKTCDCSANGEVRNTHPTILEHIDISHDRVLNGIHGGKEYASSVKKKVLSRRIIQKEVSFKSCHVKL